ncbi:MAG TPA: sigma-54 dependent transcriptional regulator [Candidatus Baltobacteraceae bacterium]|jgi:two-component system, NtrC family, nitrogen regulation response regulator NtrX|nr:sigma-54 dependent transcriptional regulator [Candidatus Baltobacteraceae bacterium]
MPASILIVDDESGIRESLGALLRDEGYDVEEVASGEECLERLKRRNFDLVLLDVWLTGMDGLNTLERMQTQGGAPMVVMISGHGNIETAVRATKLGAFDFIEKPLSVEKVMLVARNALEYLRLEEENRRLRAELEEKHQILGASVPMKALRQQIALTAPTNGRVLIYGESGTGKELVARALHENSPRSAMPFVEVNCAAIPEELIESEMFGHRKGSFTGASEDKVGKFQKADGGTLFLDEVGDMSLKTQSKVLRVLEEQRVEPLGSNRQVNVDVRVIAATNKKLEDEIGRNTFREDLFYRLNVIPFYVPPLRERTEDLPVLAAHFLNEFCEAYGKRAKDFTGPAMEVLLAYPWPGNVRELRNLVERLVIMCPSPKIEPHHLPPELFRGASKSPQKPYESLQEARSAYERDFVLRKLEESRWNMTKAAAALGLERSHLYRKMRSLGIAPSKAS